MIVRERKTKETDIRLELGVDGAGEVRVQTGHGFFDHMLQALASHAGWDFNLQARGDLEVDEHHLVEDVALVLGSALQEAWRGREGMHRYGQRFLPMDEALILAAVDLCGRPTSVIELELTRESVGGLSCEMVPHFFKSLADAGQFALHVRKVTGVNHHHLIEGAFKALAYALREALGPRERTVSTKGVL